MDISPLVDNVLSPPILFFFLGMLATLVKSDLSFPTDLTRLFSLYLLWAIGFKGGVALRSAGLSWEVLAPLLVATVLSALIPLYVAPILRFAKFNVADACATAGAYGSVSVVTFITAQKFLENQGIGFGGHLVAALALMEAPAVVVAVLLHRHAAQAAALADPDNPVTADTKQSVGTLLREAVLSGPVFLLLGSLLVGVLAGERGYEKLRPFTEDVFYGMLVLFLLDAGMTAARRLGGLKEVGAFAVGVSIGIPLVNAAIGWGVSWALGLSAGDAFLFMILAASASYIAVPATMQIAIPEANASLYLPMALGVTFPFNIILGIPLYLAMANALPGVG